MQLDTLQLLCNVPSFNTPSPLIYRYNIKLITQIAITS